MAGRLQSVWFCWPRCLELSGLRVKKAAATNLLERPVKELGAETAGDDARLAVPFGAAEIVTVAME